MKDFRTLYDELVRYEGTNLYQDVLLPFLPYGLKCMNSLEKFKQLESSLPESFENEDLWSLFALNVCNDYLLLPMRVSLAEYIDFFEKLGFNVIEEQKLFNPILHEIVQVYNHNKEEEGSTVGFQYWSGLRYGELIFSRSGIEVSSHKKSGLVEGVADSTTLYFTNCRINRKASDLSHDWGHNSRWRTDFHRNYITKDYSFINVDAEFDLYKEPPLEELEGLTLAQARELLINRCIVEHHPKTDDFFPYNWNMTLDNKNKVHSKNNNYPLQPNSLVPTKDAIKRLKK